MSRRSWAFIRVDGYRTRNSAGVHESTVRAVRAGRRRAHSREGWHRTRARDQPPTRAQNGRRSHGAQSRGRGRDVHALAADARARLAIAPARPAPFASPTARRTPAGTLSSVAAGRSTSSTMRRTRCSTRSAPSSRPTRRSSPSAMSRRCATTADSPARTTYTTRSFATTPRRSLGCSPSQLTVLGETCGSDPELLADGGHLQRLVAELHGAQRHRLGWSEADIERETKILVAEVERAINASVDTASTHEATRGGASDAIAHRLSIRRGECGATIRARRRVARARAGGAHDDPHLSLREERRRAVRVSHDAERPDRACAAGRLRVFCRRYALCAMRSSCRARLPSCAPTCSCRDARICPSRCALRARPQPTASARAFVPTRSRIDSPGHRTRSRDRRSHTDASTNCSRQYVSSRSQSPSC